jgi:hypothetical protein
MTEPPAKVQRVGNFSSKTEENVQSSQEQSVKEKVEDQVVDEVKAEVKAEVANETRASVDDPPYINDPQYLYLSGKLFGEKMMIVNQLSKIIVAYKSYLEYLTHINRRLVELFFLQMNILPDEIYFNMIFKEAEYKNKLSIVEKRISIIENICKVVLKKKNEFNVDLLHHSFNYPLLYEKIKPFN